MYVLAKIMECGLTLAGKSAMISDYVCNVLEMTGHDECFFNNKTV